MRSVLSGLTLLLMAGTACQPDVLAPSSQTLAGRWSVSMPPLSPYSRTLEFTVDGHYLLSASFRGIYAQLPADSVGSISREYGSYVLTNNILRFSQDSVRSWDYLSGTYFHAGPVVYIEGQTDPKVELTNTQLTLRYSINPGGGLVAVTDVYQRDRQDRGSY